MNDKDIKDLFIEELSNQINKQNKVLESAIQTIDNVNKENAKTVKFVIVTSSIVTIAITCFFIFGYFFSDYKSLNTNTSNYNENVNKNITQGEVK